MKILNTITFLAIAALVWMVSNSLTQYHLTKMEEAGEIPYGPIPEFVSDSYSFSADSTSLLQKYSLEKVNELTKNNFENIVLNSLCEKDQSNLKVHLKRILETSEEYQLDPFWMLSIVMVESRFVNTSTSSKNALGLMQIRPNTASHIYQLMNRNIDQSEMEKVLFNSDENLEIGAFYLKKLLQNFRMNFKLATMAYNIGPNKLKNIIASDEISPDGVVYYDSVLKNYLTFLKSFKREIDSYPSTLDSTYVVESRGVKLDETLLNNMGYFSYIPTTSENYTTSR